MIPPATPTPEVVDVKRLDHLPLVGAMRRDLAITDTLEALIPPHERHAVTVGECIEALVRTILTGEQALSRVAEPLAGDDLEVICPPPMEAGPFHDNRLGRVLDALWTRGLDRVYGAVIRQAIQRYALELTPLHTATTSLKVYGAYERDAAEEGPVVTFGDSRDHRPDLKPRLFGLTVTADGLPVWGHVADGNGRDSTAHRFHIAQLRRHLPDLGAPLLVADRQCFAGETRALAAEHRFRFVTLVPQTVGLRQEVVEGAELGPLPLLWDRPGRRQGARASSHGVSGGRSDRWKTAAGEVQELPVRFLIGESTPLATATAPRAAATPQAARAALATFPHQWPRRSFACEADAHQAAPRGLQELSVRRYHLTSTVGAEWVAAKRPTRGRPPKAAPRPQRQVWRVPWPVHEATEVIAARTRRDRRFVLATNVLEAEHLPAAELLRASKGQPAAELSCTWAQTPAAMAPIFLEPPTRIAALGCVYLIALLVYTLVERHVRHSLAERRATWPDRPVPSPRPTARPVFQRMRHMAVVTLVWAEHLHRQVTTLSSVQGHVISLLGYASAIYAVPHQNSS